MRYSKKKFTKRKILKMRRKVSWNILKILFNFRSFCIIKIMLNDRREDISYLYEYISNYRKKTNAHIFGFGFFQLPVRSDIDDYVYSNA